MMMNQGVSRGKPRRRRSKSSRSFRRIRRGPAWLTPQLLRRLEQEARQLKMTPNEYTRLLLSMSTTLRENLQLDTEFSPRELLNLMENPLFSIVFKWVAQNALSALSENKEPAAEERDLQPASPQPRLQPDSNPPRVQPPPYWDVW